MEERADARAVREASDDAKNDARKMQMHIAKLAAIKTQTDSISLQLRLFHENRAHFEAKHGAAAFQAKVNALLDMLPMPSMDEDAAPAAAAAQPAAAVPSLPAPDADQAAAYEEL